METLIERLKTHDEVIDMIEKGFEGTSTYQQAVYVDSTTRSLNYPCGTQFCLLGAVVTGSYKKCMEASRGDIHKQLRLASLYRTISEELDINSSRLFLGDEITEDWKSVFVRTTPLAALSDLQTFLTKEQFDRLYSILKQNSEADYLPEVVRE